MKRMFCKGGFSNANIEVVSLMSVAHVLAVFCHPDSARAESG